MVAIIGPWQKQTNHGSVTRKVLLFHRIISADNTAPPWCLHAHSKRLAAPMFLHRKELIQPVNVGTPDARFGTYLLEQFGGATGELTAALQYWVQSFHVENAGIRDMLQDIAIEEFSHLEMVGKLIAQHTSNLDQTSVHDAPLFKIKGGVRTSWTVKAAAGRRPIFRRAAMSFAICERIFQPKPGPVKRTSRLSRRATTRALKRHCTTCSRERSHTPICS